MTHNFIDLGPKIALFEPDIPQNTAAIIRTCACLGAKLEIIEPCGFLLNDKRFKRVVMDYMDEKKGPPPEVNLFNEKNNGESLLNLIQKGHIKSAHDISLGGIITAVSKMAIKGNKGIKFNKSKNLINEIDYLFSEDQGRYIIEINPKDLKEVTKILDQNSVYHEELGIIIEKDMIINQKTKVTIDELKSYNSNWLTNFMSA